MHRLIHAAILSAVLTFTNASPAKAGLIHQWTFSGGSGATIVDSIGGAHGTALGGTQLDGSGSITLDGVDDYVNLPNGLISSLSVATFEAWITWDGSAAGNWQRVFDFGTTNRGEDPTPGSGYTGTEYLFMTVNSGFGGLPAGEARDIPERMPHVVSSTFAQTGQEIHMALTYSTDTLSLYMNGNLVGSGSNNGIMLSSISDNNNWLGRSQFFPDANFDGSINEFRIYNSVLTAPEVLNSYNSGPSAAVPEPSSFFMLGGVAVLGIFRGFRRVRRTEISVN
ncbi:MAG: hypothetical protein Fues2KO_06400 [Fuerstiella sp.]